MDHIERRAELKKHPTAQRLWLVIIVVQGLGILVTLAGLVSLAGLQPAANRNINPQDVTTFKNLATTVASLSLVVQVLVTWGIWRVEKWVIWILWLSVILNAVSFNYIGLVVSLFSALAYNYILKQIQPPSGQPAQPAK